MNNTLDAFVFVRDFFAGVLRKTEDGYSFKYDDEYVKNPKSTPVSLTMPITNEEYTSNVLFPFFDGLIPEGWLLDIVTANWKIDPSDRFSLLLIACKDPIGNVSIREKKI